MSISAPEPWQEKATIKRAQVDARIPKAFRLREEFLIGTESSPESVLEIPAKCGILSPEEIAITENYTAISLAVALATGKLSAFDVATAFCKRAAIAQQLTSCLTEIMFDQALERARFLDEYMEKEGHPIGPLHGLPISIKDSFNVAGVQSTLGYVSFIDHAPADKNSPLVDILLSLGAVLHVKTNIPQTLMTADSDNHIFGRVLNPHRLCLSAGGSSGGEGACVSMRGSILGIGTDIGGSIRIPALCNGIYGFKPSSDRIPYSGQTSAGRLGSPGFPAAAGPLANSFADLELLMKSVINARPWDLDAQALAIPWNTTGVEKKSKLRIGLLKEDLKWPAWPPVRRALDSAARKLADAGHEVIELDPKNPSLDEGLIIAYESYALDPTQQAGQFIAASGEPMTESLKRTLVGSQALLLGGGNAPGSDVFDLNVRKRDYQRRWNEVFVNLNIDVVLCLGAQTTAPPHDTFGMVPYTAAWNALEFPAVIVPFMKADKTIDTEDLATQDPEHPYSAEEVHGAPLAVQIVARRYHDEKLLEASQAIDACFRV
ncbi:amidase family protein [Aureobasidium pullulans]|nr:amidase family protein [Aureobasidium pullulans]